MRRIEPNRRLQEIDERAQHQARGDERHDRQRDFRDDESALQRAAAHHRGSGAARIERLTQRIAGEEQRGNQAEHDAGRNREPDRPEHDEAIDRDLGLPRQMDWTEPIEDAYTAACQQQPARAAEYREHEVLGQELPHEAEPRGAQRTADRELALARLGPRQHQVRDVDARDEQHEADGDAKRHQRRLGVARDDFTQGADRQAQPLVRIRGGMRRDESGRQRIELGLGLRHVRARREASDQHRSAKQARWIKVGR